MDMNIIKKETSHMFIWFSDGNKIPEGVSVLPENDNLQYVTRLREECEKLAHTNTPVYLIYMGRLLDDKQKEQIKSLHPDLSNLFIIDYDDIEKKIPKDERGIESIAIVKRLTKFYKNHEDNPSSKGLYGDLMPDEAECCNGIMNLVDFTRIVLMYYSDLIGRVAQEQTFEEYKENIIKNIVPGIIYRDFDVTLKIDKMHDLEVSKDIITSSQLLEFFNTNLFQAISFLQEKINKDCEKRICEIDDEVSDDDDMSDDISDYYKRLYEERDQEKEIIKSEVNKFFQENFFDIDKFEKNVKLILSNEYDLHQEEIESENNLFQKLSSYGFNMRMFSMTLKMLNAENSFIAVNSDNSKDIEGILDVGRKKKGLYMTDVVRSHIDGTYSGYSVKDSLDKINSFLKVHKFFQIDRDLTWQMSFSNIYNKKDKGVESSQNQSQEFLSPEGVGQYSRTKLDIEEEYPSPVISDSNEEISFGFTRRACDDERGSPKEFKDFKF